MININYQPILTNTTKETFLDYIDSLDIPQIDYFAIGVQNLNDKKSISLMSSEEWQQHFVRNQYAEYDPIRRISLNTNRNIIPFKEIDFVDNFGKEIMRQRAKMGIKDGIILMERFKKFNFILTLGTGFSNFDSFDFLKRYHDKLSLIKMDFINLIQRDVELFLPKEMLQTFNHLSIDAK